MGRNICGGLMLCLIWFSLASCSGGNTNSGAGPNPSSFAGNFGGDFSITVTAINRPDATTTTNGTATATITQFNRIDLTLSNGIAVLGSLDPLGQFAITANAENTITDASCTQGTISLTGGLNGTDNVVAQISSSNLVCDGLDVTFQGQVTLARS